MRKQTCLRAVGALALALGCWSLVSGGSGTVEAQGAKGGITLADDDFKLLVDASSKLIQEILTGKPDKKSAARAKTAAIYIALYAQADGNAGKRVAVRDAAMRVADLIDKGNFDEAKKEAADLANAKPGAKAGTPVALGKGV